MRPEKQYLLDEMKAHVDASKAMIVTSYRHFSPNISWGLREELAKNGAQLNVVKKRVFLKAIDHTDFGLKADDLEGNIGVVLIDNDGIEATKSVFDFNKSQKNLMKILCGRFENKILTADEVEQLSKLPGKDEMRAQLLGMLEAPMSQTLAVFESLLTSVMHCLQNKSEETK